MITEKQIETFIEQAQRAGKERLMLCSSGNISWRVDEQHALVSATGSWLSGLTKDNVALCRIDDGTLVQGPKASMESTFHLGLYKIRRDVNVVLHFQSEYATIVSCMKDKPKDFNVTAEIPCHIGKEIPVVPYFRPGSKELADAILLALTNHNGALMSKHGQVVCGKDFDDAFQKAVFMEMACRIIVGAGPDRYLTLTADEIDDLDTYILGKVTK